MAAKHNHSKSVNTACWNFGRFNMIKKQTEVRELVKKHDVIIVGLLDSRIEESKVSFILDSCLPAWMVDRDY